MPGCTVSLDVTLQASLGRLRVGSANSSVALALSSTESRLCDLFGAKTTKMHVGGGRITLWGALFSMGVSPSSESIDFLWPAAVIFGQMSAR